jgi:hypothetical protein
MSVTHYNLLVYLSVDQMSLKLAGVTSLSFEGRGERIARGFYIPVLKQSVAYDRATGYFSVESLVHAASGVAGLVENGGKMRLILGAHDVPKELWEAYQMGLRTTLARKGSKEKPDQKTR